MAFGRSAWVRSLTVAAGLALPCAPQVHSPKVLRGGQPDSSDLKAFAETVCANAGAKTPRERAEAIWRHFLTDGRFVKPGFWYHIAGWAYEEPRGEVLDPIKLLNSYGFGLCYQIAPLLEATWKAAGFADARVWFLTGHTVAEVFYDGAYHHFDSDVMGYSTVGSGPPHRAAVASVAQLESDSRIMLGKLKSAREADPSRVADPWYPADVRAGAMDGLAALFTTKDDNHLFPYSRSPGGHSMDFVLRPGETLIRYFEPERPELFYLPYKRTGSGWGEFPQEVPRYGIRTEDGPRSQKDARRWGTGRFEYRPAITAERSQVFDVQSPYVIIDAQFELDLDLREGDRAEVSVSADDGQTWSAAGAVSGPRQGKWITSPETLSRSEHGTRTAIGGRYGYQCSIRLSPGARMSGVLLRTRVQLNPRTLPEVKPGRNEMIYSASARERRQIPVLSERAADWATRISGARLVSDGAQGYWVPEGVAPAELIFRLRDPRGAALVGISAGGRILDLRRAVAPDKLTAEIRAAVARPKDTAPSASIAWSLEADGPYKDVWVFEAQPRWLDGKPEERVLLWPEVDKRVSVHGAKEVFVRYRFAGLAMDDFRLATESNAGGRPCALDVTHVWRESGSEKKHVERIAPGVKQHRYSVQTPEGATIENSAIVMDCRP